LRIGEEKSEKKAVGFSCCFLAYQTTYIYLAAIKLWAGVAEADTTSWRNRSVQCIVI